MSNKKRIFIIHGWSSNPDEAWYPWIEEELEKRGYLVFVPEMPNTDTPIIEEWVNYLKNLVGRSDENTYFVGHSIGCQTILRYIEQLSEGEKVGGAVFVAGWFDLLNLEEPEEIEVALPWLETPIDFNKVKSHCEKFIEIMSDNDPYVPLTDEDVFMELGAKVLIEHDKEHFSSEDNIFELPIALECLLGLIGDIE